MSDALVDELRAEIEREREVAAREQLEAVGDRGLLCLAAVPVWTRTLARRAQFAGEGRPGVCLLSNCAAHAAADEFGARQLLPANYQLR